MTLLVVGMNPANRPYLDRGKKNPTFKKLESWMDSLGVKNFSFINTYDTSGEFSSEHVDRPSLKMASKDYLKIVALGNHVSKVLNTLGIDHYRAPHPSPRNRKLNDKSYERSMLDELSSYLRG